ncbi:hypothetical protein SEA_DIRTYBOI_11 [Gordonia phage DirtyBoi]|nr:hypothetical protein SEA_DIRTYBOI_11 [Gordonia phage DirtyBoi]
MDDIEFRLDRRGAGEILKSAESANAVSDVAHKIRDLVDADVNDDPDDEIDVIVTSHTTDRAVARVTIAHPRGRELQAKRGALTRAAAKLGLEVRAR